MTTRSITSVISNLFDLSQDTDYSETDAFIRKNVDFKSANSWTLVFAIFIASVGLNVNSTAIIIGAMLISPLMGPIVGAGYGLGIHDFPLVKRALRNLGIAIGISLVTSTFYFLLSPLSEAQSELLARTSPTFYDVLIACFGGATGIVAISRTEKSNAIPGVAIATALMPPLCTAGYGLANLHFNYFVGAMYLFIINSVFIAISTYVFVRLTHFAKMKMADIQQQKKIDRWVMSGATMVIAPSLILAWFLMTETSYRSRAIKFIDNEFNFPSTVVLEKKINYSMDDQSIVITLVGDSLPKNDLALLKERMHRYDLDPSDLKLKQVSFDDRINQKLTQNNLEADQLALYQLKNKELQDRIDQVEKDSLALQAITKEILAFSPKIKEIFAVHHGYAVIWSKRPRANEKKVVETFLRQRLANDHLELHHMGEI